MFAKKPVTILGVPFGLGGSRPGASLGPDAIRFASLVNQLSLLAEVEDCGNVVTAPIGGATSDGNGIRNFEVAFESLRQTRPRVDEVLGRGRVPVVLGGDHSLSIATVSAAVGSAEEVGLLWIDAHADLNTPDTSPSGNLHGMSVAALLGLPCESHHPGSAAWEQIQQEIVSGNHLKHEQVVWLGLRDLDPGERERIIQTDIRRAITMYEIDHFGLEAMMEHAAGYLERTGVRNLWISLDVDVLDPLIAPGTGTGVRGGLTYREMHLLAEFLYELVGSQTSPFDLIGVDVVEVNPPLDRQNETARLATEWLCSLFGKRILPRWV
ncbi:MAG: arginase [Fimbriimonadales bacterium]|nr:MAG: arginase [Fimbriimonadales bacterium]